MIARLPILLLALMLATADVVSFSAPARAQDNARAAASRLYAAGITGPEFQAVLKKLGQHAELMKDKGGDPELRSTIEGINYVIFFYGCNQAAARRCLSYQFYVDFKGLPGVSVQSINDWNSKKRFSAASLRSDGSAELRLSVNIDGGVTESNLAAWIEWWRVAVKEFKEHVHYK